MSEQSSRTGSSRFPTFKGLFSWRVIRACIFALACLFTLIALFYAEENWRGARSEAAYRRQLEAKGRNLDWATFVPPPVPDAQNFATTPFFAPLFDFLPGTQTPRDTNAWHRTIEYANKLPDISKRGDWRSGRRMDLAGCLEEFEKSRRAAGAKTNLLASAQGSGSDADRILEQLAGFNPVLEELRAASGRSQSRFNLKYDLDNPAGIVLPHLAKIKGLCIILELRAVAELQLGQTDAAAADVDLMFHLTDSLKSEPILISQLVRIACLNLTLQVIWEGLSDHKWSEAQLQSWQRRLQPFDFIADLKRTLESERAWGDRIIDWTRNNRHKHAFDELADFPLQSNSGSELVDFMFRVCPSGWFDLEKLNYNRMFEELVMTGFDPQKRRIDPAVCASNQQRLEESFSSLHGLISNHAVFARLLIPALTRVTQRFALGQCNVDQAVIACALERYRLVEGHYPDALDSLVPRFMASLPRDVITGDPLKYRRTGDEQFLLYSVGWNGKDDGGTIVPVKGSRSESQDITQGDWVWRFPNTQP